MSQELQAVAQVVGADWKQHAYYEEVEKYMAESWEQTIWPFIKDVDLTTVVDLAAGHGRNSAFLLRHCSKLYVVDINEENIVFCQKRFGGDARVHYVKNDGISLAGVPSGEVSLVYSWDAMVHFDSDVIRSYIRDFARVLRPGGHAFIHHSNYTGNPTGDVHENPHWRNFMSAELFAHYAAKEKLLVKRQLVFDWEIKNLDCATLLQKPA